MLNIDIGGRIVCVLKKTYIYFELLIIRVLNKKKLIFIKYFQPTGGEGEVLTDELGNTKKRVFLNSKTNLNFI